MPLPESAPEMRARMAQRRSASAGTLVAPGPSEAQLAELLYLAARAPDHGKLFPWRFIVMAGDAKAQFAVKLEALAPSQPDPNKAKAALAKLRNPPLGIAVVSRVKSGIAIPEWEQILSSGAVCMNLLNAADAMGFGANWITDWYSYDAESKKLLGLAENERVAGFVFIGTASTPPLERDRPDLSALTTRL
jgi:nitroreductase